MYTIFFYLLNIFFRKNGFSTEKVIHTQTYPQGIR